MKQETKNTIKRDASIEVYRVFLMFLICLLHSVSQGIASNPYLESGLLWAVCGFVFISGWFGIHFSPSKFLRLFFMGMVCGGIAILLAYIIEVPLNSEAIVFMAMRQWFLCAYLVLMLLAPFVNAAIDNLSSVRNGAIAIIILAIWNWLSTSRIVNDWGPMTSGLGNYSFIMMLIVYIAARMIRKCHDKGSFILDTIPFLRLSYCILSVFIILMLCWRIHLGDYSSPLALTMAVLVFFTFLRIKLKPKLERIILFIAPSMFSIYLIHTNKLGFTIIKELEMLLDKNSVPLILTIPLTAFTVFCICLGVDLIRRCFAKLIKGCTKCFWLKIDYYCDQLTARICSFSKV